MRKIIAVLASVLMIVTLAACGKKEEKQSLPEERIVSDSTAPPVQVEPGKNERTGSRVLIAYFSVPEDWWGDSPMPVYSFLEEYDFGAKTIIPFVTQCGF